MYRCYECNMEIGDVRSHDATYHPRRGLEDFDRMDRTNTRIRDPLTLDYVPRTVAWTGCEDRGEKGVWAEGEGPADIYERVIIHVNARDVEMIIVGVKAYPLVWDANDFASFLRDRRIPR